MEKSKGLAHVLFLACVEKYSLSTEYAMSKLQHSSRYVPLIEQLARTLLDSPALCDPSSSHPGHQEG